MPSSATAPGLRDRVTAAAFQQYGTLYGVPMSLEAHSAATVARGAAGWVHNAAHTWAMLRPAAQQQQQQPGTTASSQLAQPVSGMWDADVRYHDSWQGLLRPALALGRAGGEQAAVPLSMDLPMLLFRR